MASNGIIGPNKGDEEQGIANPSPDHIQESPPPYQPSPQNYGSGADATPPSYDQSQMLEPPPSYESLYGQVRAAKQESASTPEFFKKFLVIVLGTLGCTICVGLIIAVPVSMIVMGSVYFRDCPRERYIPIYLIVAGCFGVVKNLSSVVHRIRNRQSDQDQENAKTNPFDGTLNCFLLAWFIAGNVWIYRIYNSYEPYDNMSPIYCDQTLYVFAFWVTTSVYIMAGLTCFCICCVGIYAGLTGEK